MLHVMVFSSTSFYNRYAETDSQNIMRLLHRYGYQTLEIKLRRHILSRFAAEIGVWTA